MKKVSSVQTMTCMIMDARKTIIVDKAALKLLPCFVFWNGVDADASDLPEGGVWGL